MSQKTSNDFTLTRFMISRPTIGKIYGWLASGAEDVNALHGSIEVEAHFEDDDTQGIHIRLHASAHNSLVR